MERKMITKETVAAFERFLEEGEKSPGTVEKYLRDVRAFVDFMEKENVSAVTGTVVMRWKEALLAGGKKPVTVNSNLAALNCFFTANGWEDCRVKPLRVQRRLFRESDRELTQREYRRMVETARTLKRERLALLMEAICATGIRVSEVKEVTVEAAEKRKAEIRLKGKVRVILLPAKLCRKLLKYAKKQNIVSGEIFLTRNGKGMSRKQIWAEMKAICHAAGVEPSKVFPHNLRHLFARCFYQVCHDLARLADVLGHSSIETTRIYLISTGEEHAKTLDCLRLIC